MGAAEPKASEKQRLTRRRNGSEEEGKWGKKRRGGRIKQRVRERYDAEKKKRADGARISNQGRLFESSRSLLAHDTSDLQLWSVWVPHWKTMLLPVTLVAHRWRACQTTPHLQLVRVGVRV